MDPSAGKKIKSEVLNRKDEAEHSTQMSQLPPLCAYLCAVGVVLQEQFFLAEPFEFVLTSLMSAHIALNLL
jgi:hypothetical protein